MAILRLRLAQGLLLAGAPGSAARVGADAVGQLNALCRDFPAIPSYRVERAYALRCLAEGWRAVGRPDLAAAADSLAAHDIQTSIGPEASGEIEERATAWAAGVESVEWSLANLLEEALPSGDFESVRVFTSEDALKEAQLQDPSAIEQRRHFVRDGPRFTNLLPEIRRADFAYHQALAKYDLDELTKITMTITDGAGRKHETRALKPGIARKLGVDGEELLVGLEAAAAAGDSRAQHVLGEGLLSGALGPDREDEGAAWLDRAAKAGSTTAAVLLGEYLLSSPYDNEGWVHGVALLERAAEVGNTRAQSGVSLAYLYGRGVPKDAVKGIAYLEKAAEGGHAVAAYNLGTYLATGELLKKDMKAARHWFEKAAAMGMTAGKINLAILLIDRRRSLIVRLWHGNRDVLRGEALLEEAVDEGNASAMVVLADHLLRHHADRAPAERARALYEMAIRLGHSEASHGYGWQLISGMGGDRDLEKGLKLLQQAAEAGDQRSALLLQLITAATMPNAPKRTVVAQLRQIGFLPMQIKAFLAAVAALKKHRSRQIEAAETSDDPEALYVRGVHLSQEARPRDFIGAHACYERAAAAGHAKAMHNLAYLYFEGQGVVRDVATGLDWMRRSAQSGEAMAQYHMGVCLSDGRLITPNPVEAAGWYQRAAANGLPMAMHNLAWCYLQGNGIELDRGKALDLFRQAASAGLPQSAGMVKSLEEQEPPTT